MKFTLVSDLHCDFPQPKTPPIQTPLVVVAGDTSNGLGGLKMLNKWKRKGHDVFAIPGNHEHYSNVTQDRTYDDTERQFAAGLGDQPPFRYLENERLALIGANGWYHVEDPAHWVNYMHDYRYSGITSDKINKLAQVHAEWVDHKLEFLHPDFRAIVVTHTAPCEASLDPKYEGSDGNVYYWNPHMEKVLEKHAGRIAVWCHGHTHASVDVEHRGVRVVTNPRGYPRENPEWAPLIVEL